MNPLISLVLPLRIRTSAAAGVRRQLGLPLAGEHAFAVAHARFRPDLVMTSAKFHRRRTGLTPRQARMP